VDEKLLLLDLPKSSIPGPPSPPRLLKAGNILITLLDGVTAKPTSSKALSKVQGLLVGGVPPTHLL